MYGAKVDLTVDDHLTSCVMFDVYEPPIQKEDEPPERGPVAATPPTPPPAAQPVGDERFCRDADAAAAAAAAKSTPRQHRRDGAARCCGLPLHYLAPVLIGSIAFHATSYIPALLRTLTPILMGT